MKRGKKLLILAAVLIVVAGGAFAALEFIPDEEAEVTESEVIYSLDAATLTKLSWTCDGETVSFDYNGEDWTYADDADFPLDPTRLNTMLSTLEEVTASKTIEAADDLAQYGLEEPECTITVTADAETNVILGAQLLCERATDMIGEFASAVVNGLTLAELAPVIRPHPTFNEAVGELLRL